MKRITYIIATVIMSVMLLSITSCTEQEPTPSITLSSSDNTVTISEDGQSAQVLFPVEESSATINIDCNWEWRLESVSANWCAAEITSGEYIKLTADRNDTGADRTASFTIISSNGAGERTVLITVIQSASDAGTVNVKLQGEDSEIILPEEGGSYRVEVESNLPWEAEASASWMKIEKDDAGFTLTTDKNTNIDPLTGTIEVVIGSGNQNERTPIQVTQFSSVKAMIIELTIGEETNLSGALPFDNSGVINCLVDWGDGTLTRVVESWPAHTYSEAGVYQVRIIGKVSSFRGNQDPQFSDPYRQSVTGILAWGNIGLESLKYGFYKCTNLKYIAAPDEDSFELLTTIYEGFYSNTSLESIPEGMFSNAPVLESAYCAFSSCSSLKAVPSKLFSGCSKNLTFFRLFWKCASLTEIAEDAFEGCTSVENFGQIFFNTPITYVPEGLFSPCTSTTDFSNAFNGCTGLQSIPENLFAGLNNITNFSAVFSNCTALTSIPSSLFDDNLAATNFTNAFSGCTGLKGESPFTTIDGVKYHLYERDTNAAFTPVKTKKGCFKDCTGLDDYSVIETNYPDWL